jgi:hypothetical protein
MKAGGFFTALGVLVVLGGLVWWTNKHPVTDAKKDTAAAPKLLTLDASQMEEIHILHAGSDPVVLKKIADVWGITDPKPLNADSEVVSPLTGSLASVQADRLIDDHATDLAPFGLTNPAIELDVTVKGGKVYKLQLGGDTPSGSSTYAKLGDDPKVYTVSSSVKSDLNKTLNDVRDKRFMTFDSDKLKSLVLTAKAGAVEFARNPDNAWQIVKPKVMRADALQIDDLTRRVKDAKMDIPATYDGKAVGELFAAGTKIATVHAVDEKVDQTFEVHKASDGNYYAKSSIDTGAYKVTNDTGEGLDKKADDFRAKKVFDFGFLDPTKLQINDKTYDKSGNKAEEKWTANGVQFDSITVQDVFDKLRDLTALELSEKKGGAPTLTFTVTYGDKHRVEKVVLYKDGTSWRAVRDEDPSTTYILDAKNVDEIQKTIGAIKQYQPPKDDKKK